MACLRKNGLSQENISGFKIVPESLEDITADWLEQALQKDFTISEETKVTNVELESLTSDEFGQDGGGLSGSTMLKLVPTYGGNINGNEPTSMICKITGNAKRDIKIIWRLILHHQMKGHFDEFMSRIESNFYKQIIPLMQDTDYCSPKMYFNGLDDNGNSSFTQHVILNGPPLTKLVMIMEDLSHWKSAPPGYPISKEQMILCLKNVAILHAKFWGLKDADTLNIGIARTEQDGRPAAHKMLSRLFLKKLAKSPSMLRKAINSFLKSQWASHSSTKLPIGTTTLPPWLTIVPQEDGSYEVLKDPIVQEMLDVFIQRMPDYYELKFKKSLKMPLQTLIHGDFHGGNHMYGTDENYGKVIALDYQMFGKGMVAGEIYYMHYISWAIYDFDGIEENVKEYHDALVANGVTNYSLSDLLDDFVLCGVGQLFALLNFLVMRKPESFMNQFKGIFGEEKAEGMMKLMSLGLFNKCFLILTSLYVRDKENFLLVKS